VYAAVTGEEQAHRLVRLFGLGVHRVALLDMRGSLTNILSQSDVVKYVPVHFYFFILVWRLDFVSFWRFVLAFCFC
jgi:hypothetical protein